MIKKEKRKKESLRMANGGDSDVWNARSAAAVVAGPQPATANKDDGTDTTYALRTFTSL